MATRKQNDTVGFADWAKCHSKRDLKVTPEQHEQIIGNCAIRMLWQPAISTVVVSGAKGWGGAPEAPGNVDVH